MTQSGSNIPSSAESKATIARGYDTVASKYLAWSAPRPTLTRAGYIEKLAKELPKGAKVLELGCGAGVPSTQTLISRGFDVTGVDISAGQIALAREHIPEATLIQSDMMSLEFSPASFDAVVGFYSIFHLPRDEQAVIIGRIQEWLKEGGWFLCNFNTVEGDFSREDWLAPGVTMYSSSLGVQGTRDMLKTSGNQLSIVEDEVAVEYVGRFEEKFQWIYAVKKSAAQ
ncbi:hypothetical protein VKS41_001818 [Umbelopsis sp. WA50703]|jgi:ubiquinone/menaquinone biosynthesis C-methylase UbiE